MAANAQVTITCAASPFTPHLTARHQRYNALNLKLGDYVFGIVKGK